MLALNRYINNTKNSIVSFSENILDKISDVHSIELISKDLNSFKIVDYDETLWALIEKRYQKVTTQSYYNFLFFGTDKSKIEEI